MPPGRSGKLTGQPDETWSQLQKRLIDVSFDYTEIFSDRVLEFIQTKSTASHTCTGYVAVALLATTIFLVSLGATIETAPGMTMKPNLYTIIVGPPTTGKSQAMKVACFQPLEALNTPEDNQFKLEKVSPSGLSSFLSKYKKCFMISSELSDVMNNLLKPTDDARFSISSLCQLFSGEKITIDYATQTRRTIPENTPFSILGGIQMKPMAFLTYNLAQQGSGLLDRVMICCPPCLPPNMADAKRATQELHHRGYATNFAEAMQQIHAAHPMDPDEDIIYSFTEEAQQVLHNLHEDFNTSLCEAISTGNPPPATKHIELTMRLALGIFVLNNTLLSVVDDGPFQFDHHIPAEAVRKATKFVSYCENQKETLVKVLNEISKPAHDTKVTQPTIQDTQMAILTAPGPVVTFRSFSKAFPRLNVITKQEYYHAAKELVNNNLGHSHSIKVPRTKQEVIVYVKPTPSEENLNIMETLTLHMTLARFQERLEAPPPLAISANIQRKLIELNYVDKGAFKS